MAKIDAFKTELVWPGKYNDDGTRNEAPRVSLPFQVVEAVSGSCAADEGRWRNKLIWGDNRLVMGSLLAEFAGKIDLIYVDPPFATGADFSCEATIGEASDESGRERLAIKEKAYRDTWDSGTQSYLQMMACRIDLMRDLLSPRGGLLVHCDWHMAHLIRCLLDESLGPERFCNEIVWRYRRWPAKSHVFQRMHDTILWYSKAPKGQHTFHRRYEALAASTLHSFGTKRQIADFSTGRRKPSHAGEDTPGAPLSDVWDIGIIAPISHERVGYATQKPEALLERVVGALSNEGDLVADFFCGSGTTLAVAEKLGRRWIGADLGRWATHLARKRLLGIEGRKPFEVLSLGPYERRHWQGATFGRRRARTFAFILKLYGARPVAGLAHLHGKKGEAMVHVGAVDAPVTLADIDAAADECRRLEQIELHVLGWEWPIGLDAPRIQAKKRRGVEIVLVRIPREAMEPRQSAKGELRFFELARVEAEIERPRKLTARVALEDFVFPHTELLPAQVRGKVKKWSDFIDYWAVDWDWHGGTFTLDWVAYRTRTERDLALVSPAHTYDKPGTRRIVVEVVDIFGNDAWRVFDVNVK